MLDSHTKLPGDVLHARFVRLRNTMTEVWLRFNTLHPFFLRDPTLPTAIHAVTRASRCAWPHVAVVFHV